MLRRSSTAVDCSACERYRKPNTAAPAALPQASDFNEKLQADVMWIKLEKEKVPILRIIDLATKYQVAAVVKCEKACNCVRALERGWFRHFGTPKELITDEGRGWLHEDMELNIPHAVASWRGTCPTGCCRTTTPSSAQGRRALPV